MSLRSPLREINSAIPGTPGSLGNSSLSDILEDYDPELERLKRENQRKDELITVLQERLVNTPKPKSSKPGNFLRPSPIVTHHLHRRLDFEKERRKALATKLDILAESIEKELARAS
jgi:hypothetical protein